MGEMSANMFLEYAIGNNYLSLDTKLPLLYAINDEFLIREFYEAFLTREYNGKIILGDRDYCNIHTFDVSLAILPKHLNFYPHMSILQNYKLHSDLKKQTDEDYITQEAIKAGVAQYLYRTPKQLEFAQRREAAIFRAFLMKPELVIVEDILDIIEKTSISVINMIIKMIDSYQTPVIYLNSSCNTIITTNSIIIA